MNGSKSNGNGGVGVDGAPGILTWKVGLLNQQGRYLTAESFGCKINASGSALRRKQLWTIEQVPQREDTVYVRSYLGLYLAGDKRGNATCSTEDDPGAEERFKIEYHGEGSGRWALKNEGTGYYFGGKDDQLKCYEKQPGTLEWWTIHLATHPQMALRNNNRQKYVRLNDEGEGRLEVSALVPWGQRSQVTMEFRDDKYSLRSDDGRYLHSSNSLVLEPSTGTAFSVELKSGQMGGIAFKGSDGRYLTAVGREAVLQTKNMTVGKDELFSLENSLPQIIVTAHNGKLVSYKQGIDLSANKDMDDELSEQEIYQLEFDKEKEKWRIQTADQKYWSLEAASGIQAAGNSRCAQGLFTLEWLDNGMAAIKAGNNRYVTARMNGSLYAVSDEVADKERFRITIVNKERLILRCEHGFVGFKALTGAMVDCSRPNHDFITLLSTQQLLQQQLQLLQEQQQQQQQQMQQKPVIELDDDLKSGVFYAMKSTNGKFWTIGGGSILAADSPTPVWFTFELLEQSRIAIRTRDGRFLSGVQYGIVTAKSSELEKATLWEY